MKTIVPQPKIVITTNKDKSVLNVILDTWLSPVYKAKLY